MVPNLTPQFFDRKHSNSPSVLPNLRSMNCLVLSGGGLKLAKIIIGSPTFLDNPFKDPHPSSLSPIRLILYVLETSQADPDNATERRLSARISCWRQLFAKTTFGEHIPH